MKRRLMLSTILSLLLTSCSLATTQKAHRPGKDLVYSCETEQVFGMLLVGIPFDIAMKHVDNICNPVIKILDEYPLTCEIGRYYKINKKLLFCTHSPNPKKIPYLNPLHPCKDGQHAVEHKNHIHCVYQ